MRQINSGTSTHILEDPWIPNVPPESLLGSFALPPGSMVSSLIDHHEHAWNSQRIEAIFPSDIAAQILSLPLRYVSAADRWSWSPQKSGKFTVKSAYNLALDNSRDQPLHPLDFSQHATKMWKKLWALKIPNRIHHFLWRCCSNSLPFADTLARRGVTVDDSCPFCDSGNSCALHLFFGCEFARDIWVRSGLWSGILGASSPLASTWFKNIILLVDFNVDLFAISCYFIWFFRNKGLFEGVTIDTISIVAKSAFLLSDFQAANG